MIQITSRDFRNKQASMFELADNGEEIVIKRGKKRAYVLVPVEEKDFSLSSEAKERIERSRNQYLSGQFTTCKTAEEAIKFLESL